MSGRGQSNVIGVALLLGVTVVSLGVLTAAIGAVVEANAAQADATRVAADLEGAVRPVEVTGAHRGQVSFTEGRLATAPRELRVLEGSTVVRTVPVGALVFETATRRVASVAGATVRGDGEAAWLQAPPPITASRGADGVLVVGAVALNASGQAVGGSGGVTATLRTNVTHVREELGEGQFAVAVETATPGALAAAFRERGATVSRRDFDGDDIESVLARFPGRRTGYLVVHDLHLEVGDG